MSNTGGSRERHGGKRSLHVKLLLERSAAVQPGVVDSQRLLGSARERLTCVGQVPGRGQ